MCFTSFILILFQCIIVFQIRLWKWKHGSSIRILLNDSQWSIICFSQHLKQNFFCYDGNKIWNSLFGRLHLWKRKWVIFYMQLHQIWYESYQLNKTFNNNCHLKKRENRLKFMTLNTSNCFESHQLQTPTNYLGFLILNTRKLVTTQCFDTSFVV
jgi:uncharacterized protein YqgQ